MARVKDNEKLALCVENTGAEDIEKGKTYRVLPDADAESEGYLRVVDDSGEDYLYPRSYFTIAQKP